MSINELFKAGDVVNVINGQGDVTTPQAVKLVSPLSPSNGDRFWRIKGTKTGVLECHLRHANELLGGALRCAIRGWPVHPLICKTKRPHLKEWQNKATTDTDQVRAWWKQWPYANVGVACGSPGPFVVDVDAPKTSNPDRCGLEAWLDLCQEHGIDDSRAVLSLTGGGGKQLLYDADGTSLRNTTSKLGVGIDTRGAGGYIVVPPSVHPNGKPYVWEASSHPDDFPLCPLPDALLVLLTRPVTDKKKQTTPLPKRPLIENVLWARGLLSRLATNRCDNYNSWVHVGMALSELGDAGLELWDKWSERSDKHKPGACAVKWPFPTDNENPITLGSLYHWAEEDDPLDVETEPEVTSDSELLYINAGDRKLSRITGFAWDALSQANEKDPFIFRFGGLPTRIELGDEDTLITHAMGPDRMRHVLARTANWYTVVKHNGNLKRKDALPPLFVVKDVLVTPNSPLPVLTSLVGAPTFAPDGTLQTKRGYHAKTRTFYTPVQGFILPDVPKRPTDKEVLWAKEMINDLIGEFPFTGEPELAHAVALMLLPFVRPMVSGATPLHLVEKPTAGTGGSLLINVLMHVATGQTVTAMTEGRREEEWRKRLTAKLITGPQFVFIDNLGKRLDSPALAAAITTEVWEDRILGKTETIRLPIRCIWVASGNNPTISTEIARRTIRIRMDAKQERPWKRAGFKHENLRQWAEQHRPNLVWAALVLAQNWVSEGRPYTGRSLGGFEAWSSVVGGILEAANIPGFLGNLDDFYARADTENAAWRGFVVLWWETYQENGVGISDLVTLIDESDTELDLGSGNEHSQKIRLGILLKGQQNKHYQIEVDKNVLSLEVGLKGKKQGANQWGLHKKTDSVSVVSVVSV